MRRFMKGLTFKERWCEVGFRLRFVEEISLGRDWNTSRDLCADVTLSAYQGTSLLPCSYRWASSAIQDSSSQGHPG
jgi:hypothetical protein